MVECNKRRYSKKGAEMALLETKISRELKHSTKRREKRIYYHRICKAWHITSMEDNHGTTETMPEESDGKAPVD